MTPDAWKDLMQLGFSFAVAGLLLWEGVKTVRTLGRTLEAQAAQLPLITAALQSIQVEVAAQTKLLIEHTARAEATDGS